MAGFDEGAVFFGPSDPSQRDSNGPAFSKTQAQRKFQEFIRNFQSNERGHSSMDVYKYGDSLLRDKKILRVEVQDLKAHDGALGQLLEERPTDYLPLLEAAATEVLKTSHNRDEQGDEPTFEGVQVTLHSENHFGPRSIRELTSEHVSQLVMIPGIVTSASKPKHKATHICVMCKSCQNTKILPCTAGISGATIPRTCDAQVAGTEAMGQASDCGVDPYIVLPHRSKFVDQQTLKLQERPEDVPTGDLPRHIMVTVDRHLVGQMAPGTRVTAVGVYSIYTAKDSKPSKDKSSAIAVRQPYLRVVGLEEDASGNARSMPTFTAEEEREFKAFAVKPKSEKLLFDKIAPQIFGHEDIKKAVACLLFAGSRKRMPDGARLRGDVNVLLLGDPSTAKSQFLKFASRVAPIAVYTSGKGSSAAGLTASVVRDAQGDFYLEGGAMVLADNGIVCIDEFDKMREEDRVAIHEAMEQQTISIAKAGITTMLNARTAVLAAANPPTGSYDDMKTAGQNIELQTTILSRFDLIFVVRDVRSMEHDTRVAQHVLKVHKSAGEPVSGDDDDDRDAKFLRRYLEYARSKFSPRLSEEAAKTLQSHYIQFRKEVRGVTNETDDAEAAGNRKDRVAVPITVRQLEALVRISESMAKMQLQQTVSAAHVDSAVALFRASTMQAASMGIQEAMCATAEQRQELQSVISQIEKRVPLNGNISVRKLKDELKRLGISETLASRAIMTMEAVSSVELRHERRSIKRVK